MRYKVLVLGGVAAGALLFWSTRGSRTQDNPARRARMSVASERATPDGTRTRFTRTDARPLRPVEAAINSGPRLAAKRVTIDRRPWNPEEELREVYELRYSVFEAFDRFREETGISEDRAQTLLMHLYDYQENERFIREDIHEDSLELGKWEFEQRLHAASVVRYTTGAEIRDRIADMLSPEEMRAWRRFIHRTNIWLILGFQPPLIRPASNQ